MILKGSKNLRATGRPLTRSTAVKTREKLPSPPRGPSLRSCSKRSSIGPRPSMRANRLSRGSRSSGSAKPLLQERYGLVGVVLKYSQDLGRHFPRCEEQTITVVGKVACHAGDKLLRGPEFAVLKLAQICVVHAKSRRQGLNP